jgi:hypothetical protein
MLALTDWLAVAHNLLVGSSSPEAAHGPIWD